MMVSPSPESAFGAGLTLARLLSFPPKLHPRPRLCALYWCIEYSQRHPGDVPTAGEVETGLRNDYGKQISRSTAWRAIQDWQENA